MRISILIQGTLCAAIASFSRKTEDLLVYALSNETVEITAPRNQKCIWDVEVLGEEKNIQVKTSSTRSRVQIHPFSHALNDTEVWCLDQKGRRRYKAVLWLGGKYHWCKTMTQSNFFCPEKPNIQLLNGVRGLVQVRLNQPVRVCVRVSGEPCPNVQAFLTLNSLREERKLNSCRADCLTSSLVAENGGGDVTVVASNCFGNTSVTVRVDAISKQRACDDNNNHSNSK